MGTIGNINNMLNDIVWGPYMVLLIVGTGIYLTYKLGLPQIRLFKIALKETLGKMFDKTSQEEGEISSGQAGLTALAGAIGTGNIAGVATAIAMGGPGAVFWMWVSAFFGMATKLAEITLGVHYRQKKSDGNFYGGPMYYLEKGLKQKWLAYFFSIMGVVTFFVIAAIVDTHSIAMAIEEQWGIQPLITGIILAIFAGFVVLGGIKRIGEVCEYLTPIMGSLYILAGIIAIVLNVSKVPMAIKLIFTSAFTPMSAFGGFAGSTVAKTISTGTARGLFSNEAGMGSSPMIHSSARTDHPIRQGLWGIAEVFIDTIVICTITGLPIIISGEWTTGVSSSALTMRAFGKILPGQIGNYIVLFSMILFGFSCLISMNHYSVCSGEYLFGEKSKMPINILWIICIIIGSMGGLEFVWALADTANGLMAIPNLIALLGLSGTVVKLKKDFFKEGKTSSQELIDGDIKT